MDMFPNTIEECHQGRVNKLDDVSERLDDKYRMNCITKYFMRRCSQEQFFS